MLDGELRFVWIRYGASAFRTIVNDGREGCGVRVFLEEEGVRFNREIYVCSILTAAILRDKRGDFRDAWKAVAHCFGLLRF